MFAFSYAYNARNFMRLSNILTLESFVCEYEELNENSIYNCILYTNNNNNNNQLPNVLLEYLDRSIILLFV